MNPYRSTLLQRIGFGETLTVAVIALTFLVPAFATNPIVFSVTNQVLVASTAAFSVYIMLRMNLLTFAVPTFMALGGYTVAIFGLRFGVTDVVLLAALAFVVPALFALPLGALVLRLRGVYFVLVTFVLTEITQLALFEMPGLSGGSNGLVGIPIVTFFGIPLADNRAVLQVTIGLALAAALATAALTVRFRQHFAAIEENELLAQSLGLVVWHYKALGFVVAAGVSGLAGFALVNMLLMAHPSSFNPLSSVNYIAYAIIGGKGSMLGPVVGATVLVFASDLFAIKGEYSQFLFGFLLVTVVLVARDGIVGTIKRWICRSARTSSEAGKAAVPLAVASEGRS
ncbi:branched-chain amino acid ABC transporter permease [Chelatococcus asaccharovorans]|uniref:branched-chain amino acid ABC transporter permease n=1 Tax=Chelatococcus asaccharovorans TaxID=28210 RepID=UPI00224C653F|nr:branched-chain amino acid ABC transporter permease [Chelatococcus asaccharovorans]CAH1663405.1 Branched-chain amino acid transport system permease protein [Chelatococcus asaccharovorans]CAH1682809.1 Branched-chain amino acid transport system permease protein [Chelatococcus asaccharovorans]